MVLSEEADNICIGFGLALAWGAFQMEGKKGKVNETHVFTIITEEHTPHAIFVAHKLTCTLRTGTRIVQSNNSLCSTRRKRASGII